MLRIIFLILPLTLSGCLPVIFGAATGTTLAVAKDRTVGETLTDVKLAAKIRAELMKSNFREIFTKITVTVSEGRVLFTGKVDKEEYILQAVEIAWKHPEVVEVANELIIDENSNKLNLVQYTKDSLITAQVKSKIFTKRSIKFVNYTIVTLDNTVYIFGMARSNEELEQVAEIAAKIKGVENVISHVRVKEVLDNKLDDNQKASGD